MRCFTLSSGTTFVMQVKSIFLLSAFAHTPSPPVTTGAGGPMQLFYCKPAGCVVNVTRVFCDDRLLQLELPNCSGSPLVHTVCQHNGRAFVSSPAGTTCEFEEESRMILTGRCKDHDPICLWIPATSPSTTPSNNGRKAVDVNSQYIVLQVFFGVALLLGGIVLIYCCIRRCSRKPNQQQNRDPDGSEQPVMIQLMGNTTERDTEVALQMDDDAIPQRGHGD
ncbi:uncharacterized protein FYW61_010928 isoform 1-T3 [Anableps anableps]